MKLCTSRVLLGSLLATFLAVGGLGCELIASVDRDKIDEGTGGSGGNPPVDSGPDTTPPDTGTDAKDDVDAGQDAPDDVTSDAPDDVETDTADDVETDAPDDVVEADAPDDVVEADAPDDVVEADAPDDVVEADAPVEADADPCVGITCSVCEQCVNGTCEPASDGTACTDDGNECTADECDTGVCTHPAAANDTACTDDGNECTSDTCQSGTCSHPAVTDNTACTDDGNVCTSDTCQSGTCSHPAVTDNTPCTDDSNACTTDSCQSGICEHPAVANDCGTLECGPSPSGCYQCGTCDTPPADVCDGTDPNKLLDYGADGTCNAGACEYTPVELTCSLGCTGAACDFANTSTECSGTGSAAGSVTASFTGDVIGSATAATAFQTLTTTTGQTLPDEVKIEVCTGNGGLLNVYLYLDSTTTPLPTSYELDANCGNTFSPTSGGCAVLEVVIPDSGGDITFTTGDTNWSGSGSFDTVTYGTNTISASFLATGLVDVATPTSMMSIGGTMTTVPFPF